MTGPRVGSLFTGVGGLDLAVTEVFGGRVVWQCENDPDAGAVLARRFPGVTNLGDITTVNWDDVPRVDVLAGGFPCTDTSQAGRKAGIGGARSRLWSYMAEAVRRLRPGLVVVENVAGLRSRGLDQVLGDLAEAGFDAEWASVRAADVGAPHKRERIFIIAWPADAEGDGRHQGKPESAGQPRRLDAALGGGSAFADAAEQSRDARWFPASGQEEGRGALGFPR